MTVTLLLSLAFDLLVVLAIVEIRKRRMHSLMSLRVAELMRGLRQGEA